MSRMDMISQIHPLVDVDIADEGCKMQAPSYLPMDEMLLPRTEKPPPISLVPCVMLVDYLRSENTT